MRTYARASKSSRRDGAGIQSQRVHLHKTEGSRTVVKVVVQAGIQVCPPNTRHLFVWPMPTSRLVEVGQTQAKIDQIDAR